MTDVLPLLEPEAAQAAFKQDGVVAIRQVFDAHWLSELKAGIEHGLKFPSPRQARHTAEDSSAHYVEDFWVWSDLPQISKFLHESPAAKLAGTLLEAERINLVMDNWFYREAGSNGRPPWHHDVSYFDFEGPMCVLWLALEDTKAENGIAFVRGSHLWGKLFLRAFFDGRTTLQDPIEVRGLTYEAAPDIDADPSAFDIVSCDLKAGDAVFFDIRTLHGALAAQIPTQDSARFTARFAHQDCRIAYRGDWAKGERAIFEAAGHKEGDALDSAFFPRLWEKDASAD